MNEIIASLYLTWCFKLACCYANSVIIYELKYETDSKSLLESRLYL